MNTEDRSALTRRPLQVTKRSKSAWCHLTGAITHFIMAFEYLATENDDMVGWATTKAAMGGSPSCPTDGGIGSFGLVVPIVVSGHSQLHQEREMI
jgi:hypothetical protein